MENRALRIRSFQATNEALDLHELIKVKFNSFKEQKKILAQEIEERTQSEMIGMIGHIVTMFYRQQPDQDKRKIQLPKRAQGEAA